MMRDGAGRKVTAHKSFSPNLQAKSFPNSLLRAFRAGAGGYSRFTTLPVVFFSTVLLLIFSFSLAAQQEPGIDMDQVRAEEEFEFGVRAYHDGEFNRAIQSFENSLTYKQDFSPARQWLAEAYYRSGFVQTAIDIWRETMDAEETGAVLEARLRTLEYRRSLDGELLDDPEYVSFYTIDAGEGDIKIFNHPTSIVPNRDGGFYLVSFGSNELLEFNANGGLDRTLRGGIEGLNHPFDMIKIDNGDLFVTEFTGDRITRMSPDGRKFHRFGQTGTGEGEMLGPQYIADDGKGYIYVTDQGNRRVVKFDYDGNYILSFGRRTRSYEGFQEPTGIHYYRGRVYVTDKVRGEIAVFDESGNFIRTYGKDVLTSPEGISPFREGEFLIADGDKILRFTLSMAKFEVLKRLEGRNVDIMKAVRDANDNLLTTEFDRNHVQWFSDFSQMYSGLHTEIKRVEIEDFPRVLLEVAVSRREGPPYVGLMENNFFVTEERYPIEDLTFQFAVDQRETTDIALMVEYSDLIRQEGEAIGRVATELVNAIDGKGSLKVISAGENPVVQNEGTTSVDAARSAAVRSENYSSGWAFDLGVRLSAGTLTTTRGRRALVFLGSGSLPQHAFDEYGLSTVLSYLKNNDITFYCVTVNRYESIDRELQYLCDETGGAGLYVYRPEGIGEIVEMERSNPTGRYFLSFQSRNNNELRDSYIPLEVQTSLFGRSGRAESGYYSEPQM